MPVQKICPRCKSEFLCQHENISQCACSKISINKKEMEFIKKQYKDCLCVKCLQELKTMQT